MTAIPAPLGLSGGVVQDVYRASGDNAGGDIKAGEDIADGCGINGHTRNSQGSNPDHIAFVHGLTVPEDLLQETSEIYLGVFEDLVGCDLDTYQRDAMRIAG